VVALQVSVLSATPAVVVVVTLGLYSWLGNVLAPSTVRISTPHASLCVR
jgi:hypothetical protein